MLSSTRVSSLLKILVAVLVCFWSLWYFGFTTPAYEKVVGHLKGESAIKDEKSDEDRYLEDYLQREVGGIFDGQAIAAKCSKQKWTKGLIFHCDPAPGGIGEVRNAHLNCIRFAIEAGAELILPEVVKRNEKDITIVVPPSKGTPRGVPLDYFFDRQHVNHTLSKFCPQMKLYQSIDDLYDVPMGNPISISVARVGMDMVNGTIMSSPKTWAKKYQEFVDSKSDPKKRTSPFRVILGVDNYVWPTAYDPPKFVSSFGRILRFREDARILSASAFSAMEKHALQPQEGRRPEFQDMHGFVGVHLRTEQDVWNTHFPSFDEQAGYYLDFISKSPYRLAYLATGDNTGNISEFKEKARDFNVTVFTKHDVLSSQEQDRLGGLSWDQQALVDYEVLLRADLTVGVSASSFTWNVALRRAAAAGFVGGAPPASNVAEHVRWWDGTSLIVGDNDQGMDMQMGIWP